MPTGGIPIDTNFKGKFSVESLKIEAVKLVEGLEERGVFFNFKDTVNILYEKERLNDNVARNNKIINKK